MKKRIILMMVVCLIFVSITGLSYGATVNLSLTASAGEYNTENGSTVIILMHLGELVDVEQGTPLGFTANLQYDNTIFSNVSISGKNGWSADLNSSNNMIIADTASASANTDVVELTLTINKENIKETTDTTISFKNIVISDGDFEVTTEKDINVKIVKPADKPTDTEDPDPQPETPENGGNNENSDPSGVQEVTELEPVKPSDSLSAGQTSTQKQQVNKATKLPDAGMQTNIKIAIGVLVVLIVIFKFKSRKIKY